MKIEREPNPETNAEGPSDPVRGAALAPGDTLLRQAKARSDQSESAHLTVDRHWRRPPQVDRHVVSYRYDARQGIHLATVDGMDVSLDDPCPLLPVEIAKPWGREIWFTGIEARGESQVALPGSPARNEATLPLGTYLALAPGHLTGNQTPVLLKILDPLPTPVLGELYLEVHETKQEVYVVTAVDANAWPEGEGRIRFGINQDHRHKFADDAAFRAAFLEALRAYETVRREIDEGATGLETREAEARTACLTFTDERHLSVGDVIRVPTWLPHSLQQGVQVVEFQTPTYERFILSSSQKVLTQDRWDSAHAVANMQLDTPDDPQPEPVGEHAERIVQFDEFGVWQARLSGDAAVALPDATPYALAFCITGTAFLQGPGGSLKLGAGEAALIPAGAIRFEIRADGDCRLLLAAPGL